MIEVAHQYDTKEIRDRILRTEFVRGLLNNKLRQAAEDEISKFSIENKGKQIPAEDLIAIIDNKSVKKKYSNNADDEDELNLEAMKKGNYKIYRRTFGK